MRSKDTKGYAAIREAMKHKANEQIPKEKLRLGASQVFRDGTRADGIPTA